MRISEFIDPRGIKLQVALSSQDEAIDKLIALHEEVGNLKDAAVFKEAILAREAKGSTAIGNGIAVPHGKSAAVAKAGLVAITCPQGVDYKAVDGKPSNLLFMIAAPDGGADTHLEVLSKLMQLLMDAAFCKTLVEAKTVDEFLALIDAKEAEKDAAKKDAPVAAGTTKIVAVTACPTGIAHTFMAAESLEQKAKELGIAFRVEKDGSGGAKDPLTAKEIEEADAVIVAVDKNIDMGQFDGKKVVLASTKEAIHEPEKLFEKTKTAIEKLHNADIPVQISCPIMKANKDGYDEVMKYAQRLRMKAQTDYIMMAQADLDTSNLANRISVEETEKVIRDIMENDVDYSEKSVDYSLKPLDAGGRQVNILGVFELACRDFGEIGTAAVDAQAVVLVHA